MLPALPNEVLRPAARIDQRDAEALPSGGTLRADADDPGADDGRVRVIRP
jgi:hypothetical protein